jgi:hypothetical protein
VQKGGSGAAAAKARNETARACAPGESSCGDFKRLKGTAGAGEGPRRVSPPGPPAAGEHEAACGGDARKRVLTEALEDVDPGLEELLGVLEVRVARAHGLLYTLQPPSGDSFEQ